MATGFLRLVLIPSQQPKPTAHFPNSDFPGKYLSMEVLFCPTADKRRVKNVRLVGDLDVVCTSFDN
jgi:hypothetical protein